MALTPSAAHAQDATWDGEVSVDWTSGTNWNTNAVPGPGDTVTINNGALPNQSRVGQNRTAGQTNVSAGTLTIAATLTSPITISGTGIVSVVNGGNVPGSVSVLNGGTLQVRDNRTLTGPITLNGSGAGGFGALRNISGVNQVSGNITLGSAAMIGSDAGQLNIFGAVDNGGNLLTATGAGTIVFVGAISGTGGFTKTGSGQVDLNGINTYTGTTTVESGILLLNGGAGTIDTGRVAVNGGAFGIFNDETIGSLAGTGGFVSTSASSGTTRLTVGGNNESTSYAGDLRDNGGGRFALGKIGTGTLTLTGRTPIRAAPC